MIIDTVETWIEEHREELGARGVQLSAFRGAADRTPSCIIVDFESPDHSGHLVVWSDGQAQLNAASYDTNEILLDEYRRNIDDLGLENAVSTIVDLFG